MALVTKCRNYNSDRIFLSMLLLSPNFFREKFFLFGIYCFIITICVTNCNANQVLAPKWLKKLNNGFNDNLSHPNKRDVNPESLSIECISDEDCNQKRANTRCLNEICVCNHEFTTSDNNTCIPTDSHVVNDDHNQIQDQSGSVENKSNASPKEKIVATHMLPIMIVLGIMFIGMCVALNLFSRARFRQNRSIFSNPRLLKLANSSTKSNAKRRTSPPNNTSNDVKVAETDLPKNGSYVSIALES